MAEECEKAPLTQPSSRRAPQKPDWTRFGLQTGGDGEPSGPGGRDEDQGAGEVNEIYAEHEVCITSHSLAGLTIATHCQCHVILTL